MISKFKTLLSMCENPFIYLNAVPIYVCKYHIPQKYHVFHSPEVVENIYCSSHLKIVNNCINSV